jgi:Fe-S-cluster containining protein
MGCHRCGQCCTRVTFQGFDLESAEQREDMGRYLRFHGLQTYYHDEANMTVLVPIRCKYLAYDLDGTGRKVAACKIYEDRPDICRSYLCSLARD